ncbi:MAG: hypothetical protein KDB79_03185 [Acidobacteria bacterium]|nr:hypothetical protein [Acidobacteriota bacterium]
MNKKFVPYILAILISLSATVFAQNNLPDLGIQKELAVGIVKFVSPDKIVLETKDGMINVVVIKATAFKRLPPDNLSLKAATDSAYTDVSVGDRALVTGKVADDKKSILTKTVYLVKDSDLKAQQDKERQEWTTRGISGRVSETDPVAKVITVEMRGITGTVTKVKITPKDDVKYLRYSSKSIKYQDAVESDFSAIAVGDMLRAVGDRSEDQTSLKAEQILTGAFVTVAGTVKSIDVEKNEVTITDLKTKEDVTIAVNKDSLLKKFPTEIAERMAGAQMMGMQGGGQRAGGNQPRGGQTRPANGENQSEGSGPARRGPGGGDINEMLNRFPTIAVADLKVGDMLAASSSKGDDSTHLTAIKLLAGVEPFLRMAQMSSGSAGGRSSVGGSLTIPGLDGVDF